MMLIQMIFILRVGTGVHLHHAIYSSTENATDNKLIKIITDFFFIQ